MRRRDQAVARTAARTGRAAPAKRSEHPLHTLQRSAGNRAVTDLVGRARTPADARAVQLTPERAADRVVSREPATDDVAARMDALDKEMTTLGKGARARAAALNRSTDVCIASVKEASTHLREHNKVYKDAYKTYSDVLASAQESADDDQAIEDAVQGVLIAVALSVLLPETLLVGGVTLAVRGAVSKGTKDLIAAGVGEVAEIGVGIAVDKAQEGINQDIKNPRDSAGGATSSGDKYDQAFTALDGMVGALPSFGDAATLQVDIGAGADGVAKAAVRTAAGLPGAKTPEQLATLAAALTTQYAAGADLLAKAEDAKLRMAGMALSATSVPLTGVPTMERAIWTEWIARLGGNYDLLDNNVIQAHLDERGLKLFTSGGYFFDSDAQQVVMRTQLDWLKTQGHTVIPDGQQPDQVAILYAGAQRQLALRNELLGKPATLVNASTATAEGHTMAASIAGNTEPYVVTGVSMKGGLTLRPDWGDDQFILSVRGETTSVLPDVPDVTLTDPFAPTTPQIDLMGPSEQDHWR